MINRAAVVVTGSDPLIDWVNGIDEEANITQEDVSDDATVYLVTDEDGEEIDEWIEENYLMVFEKELEAWYTDNNLWPSELTLDLFYEWFTISVHSVVEDTANIDIIVED